jgi:hypothetical protein
MAGAQSAGATFGPPPAPAAPAAPAPAPSPAPAPAPAPTTTPAAAVRIVSIGIVPRRLHRARAARRGRAAQPATRARVTVRTTRAATLSVRVLAGRPGVRRGSACVAPPRSRNTRAVACTRFVALRGTRSVKAPQRVGRFVLTPAAGGRALAPGRYRLAVTALDTTGNRVGPSVASFSVTR